MQESVSKNLKIHGHRGARGIYPENTLPGFLYAIEAGVNSIELDILFCADELIVHHNLTLNPLTTRTKGGDWLKQETPIINLRFVQLCELNVGLLKPNTAYALKFPSQQSVTNTPIPKLSEVIEIIKQTDNRSITLNIELKSNPEKPHLTPDPATYIDRFLNYIAPYQIKQRLCVQSFDWRLLRLLHKHSPDIKTGCLSCQHLGASPRTPKRLEATAWTDGLNLAHFNGSVPLMVKASGCNVWAAHYQDLSTDLIRQTHQLGLEVGAWTVNQTNDMKKMIEGGVNSITTDYPARLQQLINNPD